MTNEEAQAQYIRALLSKQKNSLFKGGSLLNPAVPQSTDLGLLATLDTSFQGVQPEQKPQQEKQASGFDQFMNNVLGFVDEIAAKFGAGFVGGWEGGLDLIATGLGALGWEDAAKWAEQDIGTQAAEWAKTSFGLGAWYNRFRNGNWDAQEWEDIGKGFLDINQAAFFAKNDLGDMRANLSDKYYGGNDEVLSQMNIGSFKAGEFMGGIAHSIGFMLPSIMTANAAGAAGAAELGVKGTSLATLGLSAAGKGGEEALNEGASAEKALAYGALSGGAEVLSEIAVGPVLAKVGLGTGKIMGVVGGKTVKATNKAFIKELAKSAFEEGMEEVSTAVVEPLLKSIYKGDEALKDYGTKEFWFDGNESVLGQFASGAVTGGLMTGVSVAQQSKTFGKEGRNLVNSLAEARENYAKMLKYKEGTAQYNKYLNATLEALGESVESWNKAQEGLSDEQLKNIQKFIQSPTEFLNSMKTKQNSAEIVSQYINEVGNKETGLNKFGTYEVARHIFNAVDQDGYTVEFGKVTNDEDAQIKGKKIIINENVSDKAGALLAHEFGVHALVKSIGARDMARLYTEIEKSGWFDTTVGKSVSERYQGDKNYQEEMVANYIQRMVEGKGNNQTQLQYLKMLFAKPSFFQKVMRLLNKNIAKFPSTSAIETEFAKIINTIVKGSKLKIYKTIINKLKERKPLTAEEAAIYRSIKDVFDAAVKSSKSILGTYTIGANKKKLIVKRSSTGKGYEIYIPSEQRTITEAVIGAKTIERPDAASPTGVKYVTEENTGQTVKFTSEKNVLEYINDIGAEKVQYEVNLDPRSIMETVEAKSESEADLKEAETKARELLKQYREKDTKNRYRIVEDGNKLHIVRTIRALDKTVDLSNVDTEGREAKAKEELAKKHKPLDVKKPVYVEEGGKVYRMSIKQVSERLYNVEYLDKNGKLVSKKELTRKELKKLKAGDAAEKVVDTVKIRAGLDSEVRKSKARATEIVNELKSKDKVSDYEIRQNERSFDIVRKPKITYESNDVYDVKYRGRTFQKTRNELKEYLIGFGSRVSNTKADVKPSYSSYFVSNSKNKYTEFKYRRVNDNEFEILENKDGNGQLVSKKLSADEFKREIKSYKYSAETLEQLQERQKGKKVETEKPKTKKSKELNKANNVAREFAKTAKFESIESLRKATGSKVTAPKNAETVAKEIKVEAKKTLDVDKTLTKEKRRIERISYKDIEESKDIVSKSFDAITDMLGDGYRVVPPVGFENFAKRTLSQINSVKQASVEAKHLVDMLRETRIETSNREFVGTFEEMLDEDQIRDLQKICVDIIESADSKRAKSLATRNLEAKLDAIADQAKEYKKGQGRTRVLTRAVDRAKNDLDYYISLSGNDVVKNGLDTLLELAKRVKSGNEAGFSAKNVRDNISELLTWYNEETINEKFEGLPYNPNIAAILDKLYNSLGYGVQTANGVRTGNLTTEQMQMLIEYTRLVRADIKSMIKNYTDVIAPAVASTIAALGRSKYGQRTNILAKVIRAYKRGFAPSYVVLEELLGGNSQAVKVLVTEMQLANNSRQLYLGDWHTHLNEELKKLGIKKTFDTKRVSIGGNEISIDQALGLYLSTKVQANFDAIDEDGVVIYDTKNGKIIDLAKPGQAAALKKEINNIIPQNYKQFADYLLDRMNDQIKKQYIDWNIKKYGAYMMRNEIGELKDNSYWILSRYYQKMDNLTKKVSNPAAIFRNAIRRSNNAKNQVMITGALGSFNAYLEQFAKELYIKPKYLEGLAILNSRGLDGTSVMDVLSRRNDSAKDIKYIKDTLEDILGVKTREATLIDKMVSAFSVAKLSLNIGSMMKQFASQFTSNIPISKTAKALVNKWTPEARAEFNKLFNGVKNEDGTWKEEPIGGLRYREASKGVMRANADSVGQLTEKIAKVGMIGISKVDLFTVSTGVYSLMVIGQDQFGYQIGSQKNIDFVKSHWTEYELSQIGNSALSKNYISRSSDSIVRYLFGFLQGANRAAIGSTVHKYGLWERNRGVDLDQLKKELKSAKATLEEARTRYELDPDDVDARKAYINAQTNVLDLQNRIEDYEAYQIAGGKAIPVNMAAGIVAQGILIALVNALMKRIKGKKDWDELNVAEEGLALAMAIGVDWVPLVNFISNMVQGYDVDIPATNLLNQFVAIFKSGASQDWDKMIKQIAWLVGDMTGIPFQTIYDYIYGALKTFDPETAYEMRSVFYGSSLQSATSTMKTYAAKGKEGKTAAIVDLIMKKYKTGSTNDEINEELASLYISGYNALPKSALTQYTDENGDVVKLTAQQITQFQQEYNKATDDVAKLVRLTEYRTLTAEERAKAIKKLYDAYYNIAKAKVMGGKVSSKMEQVIALTNGNVDMARYVIYLQKVGQITDTNKKSRKELVLDYINKLKGFTKAEKALLMYLAGYSVSGNSASALSNLLIRNGANRKEVKELIR